MLTTLLIGGVVVVGALIAIFLLARKAGNSTANTAGTIKTGTLTQEQAQSLTAARSTLTNIRMILSRVSDREIAGAGNEACAAVEKVLQTLKEKPEKIQTSRQLFNYYLPTMEKVVSRYQRIEAGKVVDPELPGKVKNYFSDVSTAMGNLYEGLFDNDKLHVDVDMEAMTIAIKRDGLLDDDDFASVSSSSAESESKASSGQAASVSGTTATEIPDIEPALKAAAQARVSETEQIAKAMKAAASGTSEKADISKAESAAASKASEKADTSKAAKAEKPKVMVSMPAGDPEFADDFVPESYGEPEYDFSEAAEEIPQTVASEDLPESSSAEDSPKDPVSSAETDEKPKIVLTLYPEEKES